MSNPSHGLGRPGLRPGDPRLPRPYSDLYPGAYGLGLIRPPPGQGLAPPSLPSPDPGAMTRYLQSLAAVSNYGSPQTGMNDMTATYAQYYSIMAAAEGAYMQRFIAPHPNIVPPYHRIYDLQEAERAAVVSRAHPLLHYSEQSTISPNSTSTCANEKSENKKQMRVNRPVRNEVTGAEKDIKTLDKNPVDVTKLKRVEVKGQPEIKGQSKITEAKSTPHSSPAESRHKIKNREFSSKQDPKSAIKKKAEKLNAVDNNKSATSKIEPKSVKRKTSLSEVIKDSKSTEGHLKEKLNSSLDAQKKELLEKEMENDSPPKCLVITANESTTCVPAKDLVNDADSTCTESLATEQVSIVEPEDKISLCMYSVSQQKESKGSRKVHAAIFTPEVGTPVPIALIKTPVTSPMSTGYHGNQDTNDARTKPTQNNALVLNPNHGEQSPGHVAIRADHSDPKAADNKDSVAVPQDSPMPNQMRSDRTERSAIVRSQTVSKVDKMQSSRPSAQKSVVVSNQAKNKQAALKQGVSSDFDNLKATGCSRPGSGNAAKISQVNNQKPELPGKSASGVKSNMTGSHGSNSSSLLQQHGNSAIETALLGVTSHSESQQTSSQDDGGKSSNSPVVKHKGDSKTTSNKTSRSKAPHQVPYRDIIHEYGQPRSQVTLVDTSLSPSRTDKTNTSTSGDDKTSFKGPYMYTWSPGYVVPSMASPGAGPYFVPPPQLSPGSLSPQEQKRLTELAANYWPIAIGSTASGSVKNQVNSDSFVCSGSLPNNSSELSESSHNTKQTAGRTTASNSSEDNVSSKQDQKSADNSGAVSNIPVGIAVARQRSDTGNDATTTSTSGTSNTSSVERQTSEQPRQNDKVETSGTTMASSELSSNLVITGGTPSMWSDNGRAYGASGTHSSLWGSYPPTLPGYPGVGDPQGQMQSPSGYRLAHDPLTGQLYLLPTNIDAMDQQRMYPAIAPPFLQSQLAHYLSQQTHHAPPFQESLGSSASNKALLSPLSHVTTASTESKLDLPKDKTLTSVAASPQTTGRSILTPTSPYFPGFPLASQSYPYHYPPAHPPLPYFVSPNQVYSTHTPNITSIPSTIRTSTECSTDATIIESKKHEEALRETPVQKLVSPKTDSKTTALTVHSRGTSPINISPTTLLSSQPTLTRSQEGEIGSERSELEEHKGEPRQTLNICDNLIKLEQNNNNMLKKSQTTSNNLSPVLTQPSKFETFLQTVERVIEQEARELNIDTDPNLSPSHIFHKQPDSPGLAHGLEILSAIAEQKSKVGESSTVDDFNSSTKQDRLIFAVPDINDNYQPVKYTKCSKDFKRPVFSSTSSLLTRKESSYKPSRLSLDSNNTTYDEADNMEPAELEMRLKLAELQRKYKEKQKYLAKLQHARREMDKAGSKRGPGRPRKTPETKSLSDVHMSKAKGMKHSTTSLTKSLNRQSFIKPGKFAREDSHRGPGRPPKPKSSKSPARSEGSYSSNDLTFKRRPGRPRTKPRPETDGSRSIWFQSWADRHKRIGELTASMKRKPGRPRKYQLGPGGTETIVARKARLFNFKGDPTKAWSPVPVSQPLKVDTEHKLSLSDEWSIRRSERIFLSDSSPQPSPIESTGSLIKNRQLKSPSGETIYSPKNADYGSYSNCFKLMKRPVGRPRKHVQDLSDKVKRKYKRKQLAKTVKPAKKPRYSSMFAHSDSQDSESDNSLVNVIDNPVTPEPQSCIMTDSDIQDGLRVLIPTEGLFYEGQIKAMQPPDIYGIVVDGERGGRPHVYSREEILRDVIVDIRPGSSRFLADGTRVCAYWSQQFSCLYPGTVAKESPSPHSNNKLVQVEFDDGDHGKIKIEHIRMLPEDYPVAEYEPNPLVLPGNRRRRTISEELTADNMYKKADVFSSNRKPAYQSQYSCPAGSIYSTTNRNQETSANVKRKGPGRPRKNPLPEFLQKIKVEYSDGDDDVFVETTEAKKHKKKHKHRSSSTTYRDRHNHKHHHKRHHHHKHHHKHRHSSKDKRHSNKDPANITPKDKDETRSKSFMPKPATFRYNDEDVFGNPSSDLLSGSSQSISPHSHPNLSPNTDTWRVPEKPVREKTSKNESGHYSDDMTDRESDSDGSDWSYLHEMTSNSQRGSSDYETMSDIGSPDNCGQDRKRRQSKKSTSCVSTSSPKKRGPGRPPSSNKSNKDNMATETSFAAFIPARQLWRWVGKSTKRPGMRGKARKEFYRSIIRGTERINVGDCAVFLSTGRPHLPFVGRVDSMWENWGGRMFIKVKWFYHPEETKGMAGKRFNELRGALFQSPHSDENDVQTISHKCEVISHAEYHQRKLHGLETDSASVYYLAGTYDPTIGLLTIAQGVLS